MIYYFHIFRQVWTRIAYSSITLAILDPQIHLWAFYTFKHADPRANFMNFPVRVVRLIPCPTAAPIRPQAKRLAVTGSEQNDGTVVEHPLENGEKKSCKNNMPFNLPALRFLIITHLPGTCLTCQIIKIRFLVFTWKPTYKFPSR